ncbi:MAG: type II toxin-antitoxin system RelE/ParE family toxin [Chitinophagaceae bacterium]|nr:type II toxin-antitoxin system RelE/ParE family toxin [Chitinophagaceae bacterium]
MADKSVYTTILSTRAAKEIIHSWNWYEDRQKGLGDRFVAEVYRKIQTIEHSPELFPAKYKYYRETLVAVFPVLIIYRIDKRKKLVRIVSVFHTARGARKKY